MNTDDDDGDAKAALILASLVALALNFPTVAVIFIVLAIYA